MQEANTLQPTPARSLSSVPRGVWAAGGALCLAVAALAGALVTRHVDNAPQAVVNAAAPVTPTAPIAGTPVPALRDDEVAPPPRAAAPATAPVVAGTSAGVAGTPVPARLASADAAAPGVALGPVAATKTLVAATRPAPAVCSNCGTVESVRQVKVKGQGTGVGAVAGGVLGGVVGNQFGHGNGRAALTVLGAVGGGFAGNEVERRTRAETQFDVRIRMRDGRTRVLRESEPYAVGTRVVVEGNRLRVQRG